MLELGEELERVPGGLLEEVERALLAVGGPGLDLGADQELAAVRLRDVDVQVGGDDHRVEQRLQGLGDERLEDVRGDRQRDAGEFGHLRRPPGSAADHRRGRDLAAGRLAPRSPARASARFR